jgi:hypothetical protein
MLNYQGKSDDSHCSSQYLSLPATVATPNLTNGRQVVHFYGDDLDVLVVAILARAFSHSAMALTLNATV